MVSSPKTCTTSTLLLLLLCLSSSSSSSTFLAHAFVGPSLPPSDGSVVSAWQPPRPRVVMYQQQQPVDDNRPDDNNPDDTLPSFFSLSSSLLAQNQNVLWETFMRRTPELVAPLAALLATRQALQRREAIQDDVQATVKELESTQQALTDADRGVAVALGAAAVSCLVTLRAVTLVASGGLLVADDVGVVGVGDEATAVKTATTVVASPLSTNNNNNGSGGANAAAPQAPASGGPNLVATELEGSGDNADTTLSSSSFMQSWRARPPPDAETPSAWEMLRQRLQPDDDNAENGRVDNVDTTTILAATTSSVLLSATDEAEVDTDAVVAAMASEAPSSLRQPDEGFTTSFSVLSKTDDAAAKPTEFLESTSGDGVVAPTTTPTTTVVTATAPDTSSSVSSQEPWSSSLSSFWSRWTSSFNRAPPAAAPDPDDSAYASLLRKQLEPPPELLEAIDEAATTISDSSAYDSLVDSLAEESPAVVEAATDTAIPSTTTTTVATDDSSSFLDKDDAEKSPAALLRQQLQPPPELLRAIDQAAATPDISSSAYDSLLEKLEAAPEPTIVVPPLSVEENKDSFPATPPPPVKPNDPISPPSTNQLFRTETNMVEKPSVTAEQDPIATSPPILPNDDIIPVPTGQQPQKEEAHVQEGVQDDTIEPNIVNHVGSTKGDEVTSTLEEVQDIGKKDNDRPILDDKNDVISQEEKPNKQKEAPTMIPAYPNVALSSDASIGMDQQPSNGNNDPALKATDKDSTGAVQETLMVEESATDAVEGKNTLETLVKTVSGSEALLDTTSPPEIVPIFPSSLDDSIQEEARTMQKSLDSLEFTDTEPEDGARIVGSQSTELMTPFFSPEDLSSDVVEAKTFVRTNGGDQVAATASEFSPSTSTPESVPVASIVEENTSLDASKQQLSTPLTVRVDAMEGNMLVAGVIDEAKEKEDARDIAALQTTDIAEEEKSETASEISGLMFATATDSGAEIGTQKAVTPGNQVVLAAVPRQSLDSLVARLPFLSETQKYLETLSRQQTADPVEDANDAIVDGRRKLLLAKALEVLDNLQTEFTESLGAEKSTEKSTEGVQTVDSILVASDDSQKGTFGGGSGERTIIETVAFEATALPGTTSQLDVDTVKFEASAQLEKAAPTDVESPGQKTQAETQQHASLSHTKNEHLAPSVTIPATGEIELFSTTMPLQTDKIKSDEVSREVANTQEERSTANKSEGKKIEEVIAAPAEKEEATRQLDVAATETGAEDSVLAVETVAGAELGDINPFKKAMEATTATTAAERLADVKASVAEKALLGKEFAAEKAVEAKAIAAEKALEAKAIAAEKAVEATVIAAQKVEEAKVIAAEKVVEAKAIAHEKAGEARAIATEKAGEAKTIAAEKAGEAKTIAAEKAGEAKAIAAEKATEATAVAAKKAIEAAAIAGEKAVEAKTIAGEKVEEARIIAAAKVMEAKAMVSEMTPELVEETTTAEEKLTKIVDISEETSVVDSKAEEKVGQLADTTKGEAMGQPATEESVEVVEAVVGKKVSETETAVRDVISSVAEDATPEQEQLADVVVPEEAMANSAATAEKVAESKLEDIVAVGKSKAAVAEKEMETRKVFDSEKFGFSKIKQGGISFLRSWRQRTNQDYVLPAPPPASDYDSLMKKMKLSWSPDSGIMDRGETSPETTSTPSNELVSSSGPDIASPLTLDEPLSLVEGIAKDVPISPETTSTDNEAMSPSSVGAMDTAVSSATVSKSDDTVAVKLEAAGEDLPVDLEIPELADSLFSTTPGAVHTNASPDTEYPDNDSISMERASPQPQPVQPEPEMPDMTDGSSFFFYMEGKDNKVDTTEPPSFVNNEQDGQGASGMTTAVKEVQNLIVESRDQILSQEAAIDDGGDRSSEKDSSNKDPLLGSNVRDQDLNFVQQIGSDQIALKDTQQVDSLPSMDADPRVSFVQDDGSSTSSVDNVDENVPLLIQKSPDAVQEETASPMVISNDANVEDKPLAGLVQNRVDDSAMSEMASALETDAATSTLNGKLVVQNDGREQGGSFPEEKNDRKDLNEETASSLSRPSSALSTSTMAATAATTDRWTEYALAKESEESPAATLPDLSSSLEFPEAARDEKEAAPRMPASRSSAFLQSWRENVNSQTTGIPFVVGSSDRVGTTSAATNNDATDLAVVEPESSSVTSGTALSSFSSLAVSTKKLDEADIRPATIENNNEGNGGDYVAAVDSSSSSLSSSSTVQLSLAGSDDAVVATSAAIDIGDALLAEEVLVGAGIGLETIRVVTDFFLGNQTSS